jgi:cysteine desulfurase
VNVNGCANSRIPHTLNLTFSAGDLDLALLGKELAFSSTSACNSAKNAPSHVLLAIGHSAAAAAQTIRLSIGRYTTEADIDRAATLIRSAIKARAFWAVAQS